MDQNANRLLLLLLTLYSVVLTTVTAQGVPAYNVFLPRNYSGEGTNVAFPSWGAVGTTQIRAVADASYADSAFSPAGDSRPTAREVLTGVFRSSRPSISTTTSAMFVAWGQLLAFDLSLTVDNTSEPFDIPCDDGGGLFDVWCPQGDASDPIPYFRSNAEVSDSIRNPVNYATSYIDADFVYGRSEDEANALRTMEGGFMIMSEATGLPVLDANGTWLIADQRTAEFPVTFAIHVVLLLEHNRCCTEVAPDLGYEGDEDIYQACRGWTIAAFQHICVNDFLIQLLGGHVDDLGSVFFSSSTSASSSGSNTGWSSTPDDDEQRNRRVLTEEDVGRSDQGGSGRFGSGGREDSLAVGDDKGISGASTKLTEGKFMENSGEVSKGASGIQDYPRQEVRTSTRSTPPVAREERRSLWVIDDYDESVNAAADVLFTTVAGAAFESALPATVRVVSDDYSSAKEDYVELTAVREDMAGFFERNTLGDIIRGAVLSSALAVDTHFAAAISNLSPLYKLPVDAIQRGRDHGIPTYNAAREAYGLTTAMGFSDVTSNEDLAALLSNTYGGDIDLLDAYTGALAEGSISSTSSTSSSSSSGTTSTSTTVNATTTSSSGDVFGELLRVVWVDQMYRSYVGDRLHHLHSRSIEDARLTTMSGLVQRVVNNVTDLPLSAFQVPTSSVASAEEDETQVAGYMTFSDYYAMGWTDYNDTTLGITLKAKGIGEQGMLGVGWGGLEMAAAQDFVICEVISSSEAECIDRQSVSSRAEPAPDDVEPFLEVVDVTIDDEWTAVTFLRLKGALDDQDYDLGKDIDDEVETSVIYSFREGEGVGQHPNANRGSATVNFATGETEVECDDQKHFVSLHGALMLIAWMLCAPIGIYYVRYRKGETVVWAGRQWYEMHEEIMIVAAEAVLPLAITAAFATGGDHSTPHAHWGFFMIAAVFMQVFTGWMRTKGLEAKHPNFSFLHRVNKHFHIWSGRFAYLAGVVQCYRGLELVASDDALLFSPGDGLDLELGTFGRVKDFVFPAWFALLVILFVILESRKQLNRFFSKGSANACLMVHFVNNDFPGRGGEMPQRLMPRTEDLPIYSVEEFNDKVLNGQSWVLVDGAIVDVSEFSHRHPGGARLILNALGTDITAELLGEEQSVGHAMMFTPHTHPESAWKIVRTLVKGYIDEDEDEDSRDHREGAETTEREGEAGDELDDDGRPQRPRLARMRDSMRLPGARVSLPGNVLAAKMKRLNDLGFIPGVSTGRDTATNGLAPAHGTGLDDGAVGWNAAREDGVVVAEDATVENQQRQHSDLCNPDAKEAKSRNVRPVYKYIFSCPGQAEALVQAIRGVCYFNMRAQEPGKGVVQRSYNAYAVRVQGLDAATSRGGVTGGKGTPTVHPAGETSEGLLCIEMRIRLYQDGAMSNLLEKLAGDRDNPVVQLQGPVIIEKLVMPPAYRNVVMIAAGTGINPMFQMIRDYVNLPRNASGCPSSRLALVWQNGTDDDLYCTEEISHVQSQGLLEVMVLISGDQRKRNVPGAALRRARDKLVATSRRFILNSSDGSRDASQRRSPVIIGDRVSPCAPEDGTPTSERAVSNSRTCSAAYRTGSSVASESDAGKEEKEINGNGSDAGKSRTDTEGSRGSIEHLTSGKGGSETRSMFSIFGGGAVDTSFRGRGGGQAQIEGSPANREWLFGRFPVKVQDGEEGGSSTGFREHKIPSAAPRQIRNPIKKSSQLDLSIDSSKIRALVSEVGGGLIRGKINQGAIEEALGAGVVTGLVARRKRLASAAVAALSNDSDDDPDTGDVDGDAVGSAEVKKEEDEEDGDKGGEAGDGEGDNELSDLARGVFRKTTLQVVVSGPRGFVGQVETILAEMGVPATAVVLLD